MRLPTVEERIAATLEPDASPVMRQDWHHLLFLHWAVAPEALQALLPAGLEVDTFQGKAYVGLVPFTITNARPVFTPPLPWISDFHEINVRTYVHRGGRDPGVWFFSLDASSGIAVAAARAFYKLPYFTADVEFSVTGEPLAAVHYKSERIDDRGQRPANASLHYKSEEGPVSPAAAGSLEHFLVERYVLYAVDEERQLYRARVHHQPYPLQRAAVSTLEETLVWAAGVRRGEEAPLRHYAREVNVKVYALQKC